MQIKIDKQKMLARLQGQKEEKQSNNRTKDILKIEKPGKYNFRAVVYPHNADPSSEPFAERFYHYGIGSEFTVYCPQKNRGEKCHICEFVWGQMKIHKGTERAKEWAQKLPKLRLFVAGLLRDSEDQNPKFLSLATREDKLSDHHRAILEWFGNDDTENWLDPDSGIDMELLYSELSDSQRKMFKGAAVKLANVSLARKDSKFGKKGEYESFVAKIKNIDDVFPIKTTEDTIAILEKWQHSSAQQESPVVSHDDETVVESTSEEALKTKLKELGI